MKNLECNQGLSLCTGQSFSQRLACLSSTLAARDRPLTCRLNQDHPCNIPYRDQALADFFNLLDLQMLALPAARAERPTFLLPLIFAVRS